MAQKWPEKETQDDFIIYSRAIALKIKKKKKIKKRGYQLSMLIFYKYQLSMLCMLNRKERFDFHQLLYYVMLCTPWGKERERGEGETRLLPYLDQMFQNGGTTNIKEILDSFTWNWGQGSWKYYAFGQIMKYH